MCSMKRWKIIIYNSYLQAQTLLKWIKPLVNKLYKACSYGLITIFITSDKHECTASPDPRIRRIGVKKYNIKLSSLNTYIFCFLFTFASWFDCFHQQFLHLINQGLSSHVPSSRKYLGPPGFMGDNSYRSLRKCET